VRILRLTNSYDTDPAIAVEANKATLCDQMLTEATGEPVETIARIIWPAPELPDLIGKWLDRYQPDLVYLVVSSYWFTYVSAPARVQRSFGPLGKPISQAGLKIAATPWLAHNAPFRLMRRATLGVIGGTTWFTPEEVNESMETCIRRILAHEGAALAVRGPRTPHSSVGSAKSIRWAEDRRQAVHFRTKELCARLHIPYFGWDTAKAAQEDPDAYQGDMVHGTESTHKKLAEEEAELLLRAWHAAKLSSV
jgi:hypothetical protein